MKSFSANPRVRGFTSTDNTRRYRLHKQIREKKINCKIYTRTRTVLIPIEMEDVDPLLRKLANEYGYKLQTEAFT